MEAKFFARDFVKAPTAIGQKAIVKNFMGSRIEVTITSISGASFFARIPF